MADTFFNFCAGPLAEAGMASNEWVVMKLVDNTCTLGFSTRVPVQVRTNWAGVYHYHQEWRSEWKLVPCRSIQDLVKALLQTVSPFPECLKKELDRVGCLPNTYYWSQDD